MQRGTRTKLTGNFELNRIVVEVGPVGGSDVKDRRREEEKR